ncbi:sirohydrochlorin chelatase [Peribacillus cavernae]|uniref:Sirohydrochlorin chelatase n=1 Tax=Peribacillus cavernae TaxID=1674310 RepID=A0A3S0VQG8_9BACI|nr:sirohydrochlorin chelatase [Peribacillus cavernae]MDQ0216922.1 sirohydrochlorin cobaltochelatase [Peribacillus cavernae]RUQ30584.1 sirohydrochlorin chelatase [Peribacillus cavernae]
MKAVLFVGHGSRLAAGNEEVIRFIEKMIPTMDDSSLIETCFLEFASPSISKGIDNCVKRGAAEVIVIPIILLHAGHSKLHIPAEIEDGRTKYPGVQFTYGQTIGVNQEVLTILTDRLEEVGFDTSSEHPDTAILLIGRGGSDADANSDFYKISRLLWEKMNVKWVESAFMGVSDPLVDEGIERCLKLGAKKIVMLPYFLFTGILMERMAKMLAGYQEQNPEHEFVLAEYFGYHPTLQTILKERVIEASEGRSSGARDLENYRRYVAEHGHAHHHHHDHDHDHHDHDHHHDEQLAGKSK